MSGAVADNYCARVKDSYSNRYECIRAKPFRMFTGQLDFNINARNFYSGKFVSQIRQQFTKIFNKINKIKFLEQKN